MIATVHGTVASVSLDSAVVEVGGIGMLVRATPGTLARLRLGQQTRLATSLVVREDALTLFGFVEEDERDVFEILQTVSGVGPRLALGMLAVHEPDALRRALAAEDVKALTQVPGIGNKGAQRILLELGDRLGPPHGTPAPAPVAGTMPEVVDALVQLGWSAKAADDAVATVLAESPADGPEPVVAEVLRAALQTLGGSRRG